MSGSNAPSISFAFPDNGFTPSLSLAVLTFSIGAGLIGGLKSLAGGNMEEFTRVCEAARLEAFARMVQHAQEIGADAIIGMRYDATELSQGTTEMLAYGTAVKLANK